MEFKKRTLCLSVCSMVLLSSAVGYQMYQDQIPNGEGVPHPCLANQIWKGVGHRNALGGGARNQFGLDFKANGFKWTPALCEMDSDGDGVKNGKELGDPECKWIPGASPATFIGLSHPGICEPLDDLKCKGKNEWVKCDKIKYACNGTSKPDVESWDVKMTQTEVPPTETNYYCQLIDLPSVDDYHVVGYEPILDNENIIHHMILQGCTSTEGIEKFRTAQTCGMQVEGKCSGGLGGWTVGDPGVCFDGIDAGLRMGKSSFTAVLLQVHWNNPLKVQGEKDGSGIKLHYTKNLRTYNLGTFTLGQMGLVLPPGQTKIDQGLTCSGECTKHLLTHDINIVSSSIHMHYTGRTGYLDVYRAGQKIKTFVSEDAFSYDNPLDYNDGAHFVLKAGDELRFKCGFKTSSRSKMTYYGDGTQDEMCFAFIRYYPDIPNTGCLAFGDHVMCGYNPKNNLTIIEDCDLADEAAMDKTFEKLTEVCDLSGETCKESCLEYLTQDPPACLKGSPKGLLELSIPKVDPDLAFLVAGSRSCDKVIYGIDPPPVGNTVNMKISILGLVVSVLTSFLL